MGSREGESEMRVALIVSFIAVLPYTYLTYQVSTMFACWNRCDYLFERPASLAFFGPFVFFPLAANLAAGWLWITRQRFRRWQLAFIMLGVPASFWYAWILFDLSGGVEASTKYLLVPLAYVLIGVALFVPLLTSFFVRHKKSGRADS